MKTIIEATDAPKAIGPYSQGVKVPAGQFIFLSGQIPLDPATGNVVEGGIEVQAERVLKSIGALLEAAGAKYTDVVKATMFLKDMNDFQAVNTVYAKYFTVNPPARSTIQVARLPRDVGVEIEVVAVI